MKGMGLRQRFPTFPYWHWEKVLLIREWHAADIGRNGQMNELAPEDTHRLNAAIGWLGLGNVDEAAVELRFMTETGKVHPDALEIRFSVLAQLGEWDEARQVAHELKNRQPDRATGYLNYTYALRRSVDDSLEACWETLQEAAERFPDEPIIPYNLACYACVLNRMDEARQWLGRAIEVGEKKQVVKMALKDEDLEPLWEEIEKL